MFRQVTRTAPRTTKRRDSGQGMTEYIIIVALIAIAAIGVVTVFGQDIRALFGASTQALAGETNVQSQAKSGQTQAAARKTLKDFATRNAGSN